MKRFSLVFIVLTLAAVAHARPELHGEVRRRRTDQLVDVVLRRLDACLGVLLGLRCRVLWGLAHGRRLYRLEPRSAVLAG